MARFGGERPIFAMCSRASFNRTSILHLVGNRAALVINHPWGNPYGYVAIVWIRAVEREGGHKTLPYDGVLKLAPTADFIQIQ
ncbi:hypothetical protein BH09CHL1_BH09CHL1_33580 [soil metagenome]